MENLQKKGYYIGSAEFTTKDGSKKLYTATVLLEGDNDTKKLWLTEAEYNKIKNYKRLDTVLVNINLNFRTDKIYYSL